MNFQTLETFLKTRRTHFALFCIASVAALAVPAMVCSQEPASVPETKAPPSAAAQAAPPPISAWERTHQEQLRNDWPWLARFKEADLKLPAPAPGENRVVFMGDSITEGWPFTGPDGSFSGKPYI